MDTPNTLLDIVRHFSDPAICDQYMQKLRWAGGQPICPKCGGKEIGQIASRHMMQCKNAECRKQFSHKIGTIFEDSKLGLVKWFVAVWTIANFKTGISSHELARALGVRQPTAWFVLHRIRRAMEVGGIDDAGFMTLA